MSFIQNFFTSRDNQTTEVDNQTGNIGTTYVGQESRLWYNPDDNSIYVSDGSTPGGILVAGPGGGNPFDQNLNTYNSVEFANISVTNTANLGNFTINDQTLSGTVTDRDVTIAVVGNAALNLSGAFHAHSTGNIEIPPNFQVNRDGQVVALIPILDNNSGAVEIVGSTSGQIVSMGNPGGMLHITGQNNQASRLYNDGISNYALYVGRRYNGTALAPTGVLTNQVVSRIGANPMNSTGTFSALGMAQISFITLEDVTTSAQGSKIQVNTTPVGSNVISTIAEFTSDRIAVTGNIIPTVNNQYTLGNTDYQWRAIHVGPGGLYIEDLDTGIDAQLTVTSNVFVINNVTALEVGNIQLTKDGIINTQTDGNIDLGTTGDTGWVTVQNAGIEFPDGSQQTTAAIPLAQRGNALGVATLGLDGKVPTSQLPAGAVVYKGAWDASTNTPTLADGVGTAGWEYSVSTGGTVNFGSGPITFAAGDYVIYNGTVWEKIPGAIGVSSFNTRTGAVILTSGDVTNALSNSSITNSKLVNSSLTINTGAGLSGGGTVNLGGSLTLTASVANVVGGTGVTVTPSTGTYTVAIGQPVGTANSVTFQSIVSNSTIQSTGNITGGNLATGGRVVATGNIVTLANVVTPGAVINSSITTSGNVVGANILTNGLISATGNITGGNLTVVGQSNLGNVGNVHITGGNPGQVLATDGSGNLSWATPAGTPTILVGNTSTTIDFTNNSTTLIYQPTGPVTLTLGNYTAGKQARVMIRFGATNYTINTGIVNAAQSTEGLIIIPTSGGGGHNTKANSTVQLLYTCFDSTAGNCYVACTFF